MDKKNKKLEQVVSTKAFLFFCVIAVCLVFGLRILELIQFIKDGFGMYLFDFFLLMSLIIVIGFVILYLFSFVGTKTPSGDLLKDLKKNMEGTFRYVDDEVKNPDGKNYISLWKMTMSDKMHQFEKLYSAEGKTKRVMKLHKELIYHIMSDPDTLMMGKDPLKSK
jgi:hypothetical protein